LSQKVRVGIIGTGGIAQGHIRRISEHPDAEVTAICDIRKEAMASSVDRYPVLKDVPQYTDFRDMLKAGNLDAVEICTPHTTHYEQTMTSLASGLNVLSEKPMVCTVKDAHDVLDAIKKSGKVFVLNYQRSYQPEFLYIKNAIASGTYGSVEFVQGLQGQEWLRAVANTWRHDPALSGGGQLNDSGSHMLAILLFVTGLSVEKVFGFIDNMTVPVDINSALSLKFKGGAQGNISVVGNAPSFYEDITIWCSKGAFYLRNGKLEVSDAMGKRHFPTAEEMPAGNNPDNNFINAINGKEEIGSTAIWGLRVIELTEAAWESAASGEVACVKVS
jgi:predicted dehydrogenase